MSDVPRVSRRYFVRGLGAAGALSFSLPLRAVGTPSSVPAGRAAITPGEPAPPSSSADPEPTPFEVVRHEADLTVVGGGLAGLCAAVAAARRGARVVLMQDRAVLGGNASSEIRMHVRGAHGAENKEAGILEEIHMENCWRNPGLKFSIWDTVLYETARMQPGLELLLNCSCNGVFAEEGRIRSVRGWQTTSQRWHSVEASLFADCSGDSVLRVCGAEHRRGREARGEHDESHAPLRPDAKTMGNSILIQLREVDEHVPFVPPTWAHRYEDGDLPHRSLHPSGNFWWLEIGGEQDTIADAEEIRDELLRIALGIWAYIKNHPDGRGHGWELDWIGALPGKRENVRYIGDHVLTQNDIEAGGRFEDIVAYGGWTMDDHPPGGIRHQGPPTRHHPAPSPYGIPYRSLYSRNVENLLFAGRNISATHLGLSSTRVMATCALLGQAAGTAAALAIRHGLSPRQVGRDRTGELQAALMDDDCWLPGLLRPIPAISAEARLTASTGDPEPLRNGIDRTLGEEDNGWWGDPEAWVEYRFDEPRRLERARLVFDTYLPFDKTMPHSWPKKGHRAPFPRRLCRDFDLLVEEEGGRWRAVHEVRENHQRLVKLPLGIETRAVRLASRRSWGYEKIHLFGFEVS